MKQLITTAGLLCLIGLPLAANDWPQWRGPGREDVSPETGLLTQWPAGGPPLAWKATGLGAGHAGISVAGGRVFTMGEKGDSSFTLAVEESSGKLLWNTKLGKPGGSPPGPRGTPIVDGEQVFALGQFGDLVCLEAASGKENWRVNIKKDFGGRCGGWDYTESPLVDGERVICTPGSTRGSMVAFNKQTGALIWQTKDFYDPAEYSSPIVEEIGGVRQYLQLTGANVVGIEATTGKLLWRAARPGRTATVPTPIYYDNQVYVSSGYGVGCNLFRITSEAGAFKTEQVYANKIMINHHGGVVRVGDYLYGFSDGKGWVCQEFKTGKQVWSDNGVGKGSLTCAGGHLYLRSEGSEGRVALIEATPAGYKEMGRFDQPDRSKSESWPHPVIANGKLYLRDQDVLLCYNVKKQ